MVAAAVMAPMEDGSADGILEWSGPRRCVEGRACANAAIQTLKRNSTTSPSDMT